MGFASAHMMAAQDEALDQAIAWAVRLASGSAHPQDQEACSRWRRAHPLHESAWQKVTAIEDDFQRLSRDAPDLAQATLSAADRLRTKAHGRRRLVKLLGCSALGIGVGALAWREVPWVRTQDHVSAIGEIRSVVLADGTRLRLNTDTSVHVQYSLLRRTIVVRKGEIFVDTGTDADWMLGRRSFWVETAEARLNAIGTRFGVRQDQGQTQLLMVEGRVAVHLPSGQQWLASAGDDVSIGADPTTPVRRNGNRGFEPVAWTEGVLVAKQMRLDALAAELARYDPYPWRCDPAVAGLRVSGVFQLTGNDPSSQVLEALVKILPVQVVAGMGGERVLKARP